MRRLPTLTRFYLEVPATDTIADWPEDRVRDELATRLLVPGRLDGVPFIEPSLVDLRMKMTSPMQDGRLFVAGDAAHVITPAGGKGHEPGDPGRSRVGAGAHRAVRISR